MRCRAQFVLAVLILSLAAPADARIAGRRSPEVVRPPNPFIGDSRLLGPGVGRDVRATSRRIERAHDSGAISNREARQLRREARLIGRLARRYGRDGLSASERAELEARSNYLRDAVSRSIVR